MHRLAALLNRDLALVDANPVRVASLGATSGLFAWGISHAEGIKVGFQLIGGGLGALLAAISLLLSLPRLARFLRAWRARGFLRADK